MPCSACGGGEEESAACPSCLGGGQETVRGCPWELITQDVTELLTAVELSEVALPVAGGLLDQTQSFVDGMKLARREQKRWEAHVGRRRKRR